jgi:hypothetical protein
MKQTLLEKGWHIYTRPYELNITGIRNRARKTGAFDDTILVFYNDDRGNEKELQFSATTDPGGYWLQHPMRATGAAILKCGQYADAYQIGLHRGKYLALVQRGPVTVYRDNNRDLQQDYDEHRTETGHFGINIHRALPEGKTTLVGRHSAGCQVFQNADEFSLFMGLCERHRRLYGNRFTYTLMEE